MKSLLPILSSRLKGFGWTAKSLLERDAPSGLRRPDQTSANSHCRLMRAVDGYVALNLARTEDWDVIPALFQSELVSWDEIGTAVASMTVSNLRDRAIDLQLPLAVAGEAMPQVLATCSRWCVPRRVIDISALWAGPLCAGLLANAGAEVIRIESIGRPDPTPCSSPQLNARLNDGKVRLALDFRLQEDRASLHRLIADADVVVTSARPAALERLGLMPAHFPAVTWVAITGYGFTAEAAHRVGFGDDCAVAGGLLDWVGGEPCFKGDALADPLTGLEAALAVLAGQGGIVDIAMSRISAAYAELIRCA